MSLYGIKRTRRAGCFNRAFALKLNRLFEQRRCTQTEVAEALKGVASRVYLWKLRTGRATNPSFQVIRALAEFFAVPVSYFSTPDGPDLVHRDRHEMYVDAITQRASRMDEEGRRVILGLMDYLISLQENTGA